MTCEVVCVINTTVLFCDGRVCRYCHGDGLPVYPRSVPGSLSSTSHEQHSQRDHGRTLHAVTIETPQTELHSYNVLHSYEMASICVTS